MLVSLLYMAGCIVNGYRHSDAAALGDFLGESVAHYGSWLSLIIGMSLVLIYEEKKKFDVREQYDTDGKMMSIFFTTRLGMWSPR